MVSPLSCARHGGDGQAGYPSAEVVSESVNVKWMQGGDAYRLDGDTLGMDGGLLEVAPGLSRGIDFSKRRKIADA